MTVSETPGRMIGPGLLLDESANNGIPPPAAMSSAVTATFCPSLNIGSRGGATGLAAVGGGGATTEAVGVTAVAEEVAGAKGAEASLLGLGAACGAGVGGATGAGANGFGIMATGGGVLSPR